VENEAARGEEGGRNKGWWRKSKRKGEWKWKEGDHQSSQAKVRSMYGAEKGWVFFVDGRRREGREAARVGIGKMSPTS